MKVWLEVDSQEFTIWTTPNPYGVEIEVPNKLVQEHEAVLRRLGELRQEILAIAED
jgi:hypothetical protein